VNLSNKIAQEIRDLIAHGVLSPGEHLRQNQLADQFKVSRVPIREALTLLAAEGIVVHDPNRGSEVARISSDEARQLYKLRRWIEADLIATIEWPNDRQEAAIKALFARSDASLHAGKRAQWQADLRAARLAIFQLSPQTTLLREALRLWTLTDGYRAILPLPRGDPALLPQHALLLALTRRDRAALIAAYQQERDLIESDLLGVLEMQGR